MIYFSNSSSIKKNLASRFAYPSVRHEVTLSEDAMLPLASFIFIELEFEK